MIDPEQFRIYIIRAALMKLNRHSEAAEELLMGVASVESDMGYYLKQLHNGPALGPFQMEPSTHDDIWQNFIIHRPSLQKLISNISKMHGNPGSSLMIYNLQYAVAMARVHFLRVRDSLPDKRAITDMAKYWKLHYNTPEGKGEEEDFVQAYHRYVLRET